MNVFNHSSILFLHLRYAGAYPPRWCLYLQLPSQTCFCLPSLIQSVILPSASVLSPPTCFFFPTTFPTVSPSPFLCSSPSQIVLSPLLFFSPHLLFVLCCLWHGVVMFFFLRSHFRTSEGDQEEIGLQKAPVPHLLSRTQLSNRKTFRASSRLPEKRAVSHGACLDSLFDASASSEFPASTRTPSSKSKAS